MVLPDSFPSKSSVVLNKLDGKKKVNCKTEEFVKVFPNPLIKRRKIRKLRILKCKFVWENAKSFEVFVYEVFSSRDSRRTEDCKNLVWFQ
jgi:hypothetical protein